MSLPIDLSFDARIGQFSATEVALTGTSSRGRAFVARLAGSDAAVSVTLRKSRALEVFGIANAQGLVCEAAAEQVAS